MIYWYNLLSHMKIGIDIVHVPKLKKIYERWGNKFLKRIFTDKEIKYCFERYNPFFHLGARFAVKESIIKAMEERIGFRDIEIASFKTARVKNFLFSISMSHSGDYAVAIAMKG